MMHYLKFIMLLTLAPLLRTAIAMQFPDAARCQELNTYLRECPNDSFSKQYADDLLHQGAVLYHCAVILGNILKTDDYVGAFWDNMFTSRRITSPEIVQFAIDHGIPYYRANLIERAKMAYENPYPAPASIKTSELWEKTLSYLTSLPVISQSSS